MHDLSNTHPSGLLPLKRRTGNTRLAKADNVNPLIKLRMKNLGIADIKTLSTICGVAHSSLYSALGGRYEMGLRLARKVAVGLDLPFELLVKVYLKEPLTERELRAIARLCNINPVDVLVCNEYKKLCKF